MSNKSSNFSANGFGGQFRGFSTPPHYAKFPNESLAFSFLGTKVLVFGVDRDNGGTVSSFGEGLPLGVKGESLTDNLWGVEPQIPKEVPSKGFLSQTASVLGGMVVTFFKVLFGGKGSSFMTITKEQRRGVSTKPVTTDYYMRTFVDDTSLFALRPDSSILANLFKLPVHLAINVFLSFYFTVFGAIASLFCTPSIIGILPFVLSALDYVVKVVLLPFNFLAFFLRTLPTFKVLRLGILLYFFKYALENNLNLFYTESTKRVLEGFTDLLGSHLVTLYTYLPTSLDVQVGLGLFAGTSLLFAWSKAYRSKFKEFKDETLDVLVSKFYFSYLSSFSEYASREVSDKSIWYYTLRSLHSDKAYSTYEPEATPIEDRKSTKPTLEVISKDGGTKIQYFLAYFGENTLSCATEGIFRNEELGRLHRDYNSTFSEFSKAQVDSFALNKGVSPETLESFFSSDYSSTFFDFIPSSNAVPLKSSSEEDNPFSSPDKRPSSVGLKTEE